MGRRAFGAAAAMGLLAVGLLAAGCASAIDGAGEATHEVVLESVAPQGSEEVIRQLPLARPPEVCGHVTGGNGKQLPVAVLAGEVDCGWAVELATSYLHDPSVVKEGQGQYAQIDGWMCMWPYVEGRSHAESYLQCDNDPVNPVDSFRIGD